MLLFSNYITANEVKNIICSIKLSTSIKNISPLELSAPSKIKIIFNENTNNLIDYIWDENSIIEDFELISNNVNSQFIEIRRKGFKKSLSDKDIRNGIFFKFNLSNFEANLNKQFIRPVNYQCS
tara:strand:- start:149 stop:520 length:372 start_codon:yes stop_codon:yes gene_type:complete